ncbi:MAG: 23S rRNA (pseudouridine(1915)-N(3))-methyltransferase RlmH [Deltaproteobacteria bacterium]|nr:23S rRNA (pseudouridine(1915)-N(3))-methyltransferase RlmH [Deltaproteobacteria bacterium]
MRIRIVAVGRLKPRALRELADGYLERVRRYLPCEEIELEATGPKGLASRLAKACGGASVVALDAAGEPLDSARFARKLEALGCRGKGVVAFLLGGPDGLPGEVLARAPARWSLSALTFPHRLARLVLAEQLYRAMTILRGEPYAR